MIQIKMPIRAAPYAHQQAAFEFALRVFGFWEGGDAPDGNGERNVQPVREEIQQAGD
jgi:hypothetical protein